MNQTVAAADRQVPGESVYGEKRVSVESGTTEAPEKIEYRVWNPFRSKLAASVLAGVDNVHIKPGCKVRLTLHWRHSFSAQQCTLHACAASLTAKLMRRCCIWEQLLGPASHTCQTLWDLRGRCMLWSSPTAAVRGLPITIHDQQPDIRVWMLRFMKPLAYRAGSCEHGEEAAQRHPDH